ncbi:hypothetical protein BWQ96_00050 [Gracilariopsis chorda]|uniref:Uncharacterized protein n=1 Tax=Gracilariopsis chorda TaxID=448386 RepID=A0A2V3JBT1_9FLOR|nr:hypothetical protein BWQ96_00050 [Gracilariopsis chorda]|eukprot:PXF49890.1 hypothetical protein BWQ96_00050 [Gracilariopsis chorda]
MDGVAAGRQGRYQQGENEQEHEHSGDGHTPDAMRCVVDGEAAGSGGERRREEDGSG